MTAEIAGKRAIESVWGTLRTLKEQWLLLAFMGGALMWLRDTYDEFAPLPATVAAQAAELSALAEGVGRLEQAFVRDEARRMGAVLEFPGDDRGVADAAPGEWTVVRIGRVRPLRSDCRTEAVNAWMIDGLGRWYSVATSLPLAPRLESETELAFGIRVDAGAAPGRARALVQFTHDCGTHRQVQAAPRLPFRVTGG